MANIAKPQNTLQSKKIQLSGYLANEAVKKGLIGSLGGEKANRLIADLLSVAANNPAIQECDFKTVTSAGMMASALNLPLAPQLGYCYVVPFKDRKNGRTTATFVLGYKGYIQLAERTGVYKKIIVLEIKESEFKSYNPMTEELKAEINEDNEERDAENTVGYYAMFELLNGFTKTLYWSRKKMEAHAKKYSKGYAYDVEKGEAWSFWSQSFDDMAKKTMLRQLIGKWGIMSTEMQTAFESDRAMEDFGEMPRFEEEEKETVASAAADVTSEDNAEPDVSDIFGEVGEIK